MLQMNCSNCGEIIESSLLSEKQVYLCPHCDTIVGVKNVTISGKKSSKNGRSSLKALLLSARDNFQLNKSHNVDSQTRYDLDKRLARLLKRNDFRLKISFDLFVQINFDHQKRLARLLNISSTGAAIEFLVRGATPEKNPLPEKNSDVIFDILLPGQAESLSVPAKIVWIIKPSEDTLSPTVSMGLQFVSLDDRSRSLLWDFIVNAETPDSSLG
jgi:DNA-directed RNA polymerase subunit RPC12/RpoP